MGGGGGKGYVGPLSQIIGGLAPSSYAYDYKGYSDMELGSCLHLKEGSSETTITIPEL